MTSEELADIRAYVAERQAARARGEHTDSDERREAALLEALDEATRQRDAAEARLDAIGDDEPKRASWIAEWQRAQLAERERDEATKRAEAAEKHADGVGEALRAFHEAWTSGGQLAAEMPIPFSQATTDEARMLTTHLVGSAATFLRSEVLANADPQKRNSLSVTIVYGDEPWHLTMARETNDVSFGLLMQRQKQEAQRERDEARGQLAALREAWARYDRSCGLRQMQDPDARIAWDRTIADIATAAAEHDARVREREWHKFLRLLSEAGLAAPGQVDESANPQFESGAQEAEEFPWASVAIAGRLDEHERRVRADERAKALREAADKILATNEGRDRMTPLAMHLRAMAAEAERGTR